MGIEDKYLNEGNNRKLIFTKQSTRYWVELDKKDFLIILDKDDKNPNLSEILSSILQKHVNGIEDVEYSSFIGHGISIVIDNRYDNNTTFNHIKKIVNEYIEEGE